MKRFLIAAVAAGAFAVPGLAAELKSGLAPGEGVTPFHPLNVNGPKGGQKACQV
jgi:hypothetical protein